MASTRIALMRAFALGNAQMPALIYRSSFQRRAFSATATVLRVSGPVPVFNLPTSNPELDTLLSTLRNEYFLPQHLPQHEFRLMFRERNHARLRDDPLTINVKGERFKLAPKVNRPVLTTAKFNEALDLMKEPSDYDAVPELIRGFNQMSEYKSPMGSAKMQKMARMAHEAGRQDILMKIARKAETIGFRFADTTAREFMRSLHTMQSGATKEIAMKAVKHALELLEIVGRREICVDKENRLNQDNVVLGTALSIVTDAYLRHNKGKDLDDRALTLVRQLKACWTGPKVELLDRDDAPSLTRAKGYVYDAKHEIRDWTPVLEGLLQTKSLLAGSEVAPWLEETSEKLAGDITNWGDFVQRNSPLCWSSQSVESE